MKLMNLKRVGIYTLPFLGLFLGAISLLPHESKAVTLVTCYMNPISYIDSLGTKVDTVPRFLLALVDLIFLIAVPIIVIFIIYAGFLFVMAGDNETQITKARTVILWTIIGAGVLLGAKALELAIQSTICSLDPANPICTAAPSSSGYSCS